MILSDKQIKIFDDTGVLFLPNCFSLAEIEVMQQQLALIFAEASPRRILEEDGFTVRSVYASHLSNPVFSRVARIPRVAKAVKQLLNNDIYVYQFKINAKLAYSGDKWDWHQDYIFWQKEDGLLNPDLINVIIFLDDTNKENGPFTYIPGSHKLGVIEPKQLEETIPNYADQPNWITNLTAKLKYTIDESQVQRLINQYGVDQLLGTAGSVAFFHSNLVHSSQPNKSATNRTLLLITYNSTANCFEHIINPRPQFLANRNIEPLELVESDDILPRPLE